MFFPSHGGYFWKTSKNTLEIESVNFLHIALKWIKQNKMVGEQKENKTFKN